MSEGAQGEQGGTAVAEGAASEAESKGSFLGGEEAAGGKPAAAEPSGLAEVFGESVLEDGKFREGYAETFRKAGLERLANKAQLTKDPEAFLKTVDEAFGMIGRKQVGGFPDASWEAEQTAEWRQSNGIPESADGYAFEADGVKIEGQTAKEVAEILHKHHALPDLAKDLTAWQAKHEQAQQAQQAEAWEKQVASMAKASESRFREEWGDGYDARLKANQDYVRSVFSKDELRDPVVAAALSHPKIVAAFDLERRELRNGGSGTGMVGAGAESSSHAMSPREQYNQIMREDPQWDQKPEKARRVNQLMKLHAQQSRRG